MRVRVGGVECSRFARARKDRTLLPIVIVRAAIVAVPRLLELVFSLGRGLLRPLVRRGLLCGGERGGGGGGRRLSRICSRHAGSRGRGRT